MLILKIVSIFNSLKHQRIGGFLCNNFKNDQVKEMNTFEKSNEFLVIFQNVHL